MKISKDDLGVILFAGVIGAILLLIVPVVVLSLAAAKHLSKPQTCPVCPVPSSPDARPVPIPEPLPQPRPPR